MRGVVSRERKAASTLFTETEGRVKGHAQPPQHDLRGKVLLEVRCLVGQVVVLRVGPAKRRQADKVFEAVKAG